MLGKPVFDRGSHQLRGLPEWYFVLRSGNVRLYQGGRWVDSTGQLRRNGVPDTGLAAIVRQEA